MNLNGVSHELLSLEWSMEWTFPLSLPLPLPLLLPFPPLSLPLSTVDSARSSGSLTPFHWNWYPSLVVFSWSRDHSPTLWCRPLPETDVEFFESLFDVNSLFLFLFSLRFFKDRHWISPLLLLSMEWIHSIGLWESERKGTKGRRGWDLLSTCEDREKIGGERGTWMGWRGKVGGGVPSSDYLLSTICARLDERRNILVIKRQLGNLSNISEIIKYWHRNCFWLVIGWKITNELKRDVKELELY